MAQKPPMENVSVEVYTTGDVLVTDTLTDVNGNFLVQGLAGGSYTTQNSHKEGYQRLFMSDTTMVTAGEVTDAGTIELLVPIRNP